MSDKHAENKALYAIDADNNLRPFLLWQTRRSRVPLGHFPGWNDCVIEPTWDDSYEYRRKIDPVHSNIDDTLKERGSRYGDFKEHARITQNIKRAMVDSPNWASLSDDKREALEMLAHKVGRVLNGDPEYHDSWHDIIGYTKLVADTLSHIDDVKT